MPTKKRNRKSACQQPNLFQEPIDRWTWDQLPQPVRQEVQKLIAQMFIALSVADADVPADEEGDHE